MKSTVRPFDILGKKVIFVTGTDTGVGKTLLTGLLLHFLRQSGCHALAMKPFCCGGLDDLDLLGSLQNNELRPDEISPYCFREPLSPALAARMHRRAVGMEDVLKRIHEVAARCDCLIMEGCGGVLVPLGENYTVADLIQRVGSRVVVVSRNRLGTINHTLLTVGALRSRGLRRIQVVLMGEMQRDLSSHSNREFLARLLSPVHIIEVPFLGRNSCSMAGIKKEFKKSKNKSCGTRWC